MLQINRHILDNGLRLVHAQDTSTQMVALNILYNVGARDENPEHTGFAHLFEHLMFGGSVNIPDYDAPLQLAGGENNAWTNNDITNYYLTVPRQNVETGFWLESDRMLSLDFSERSLEVQRGVVMEEFKQRCLNQPYGDVGHLLRPLAYRVHPYQWPTIGKELSHIANATLEEVKDFFFRFYAPNNAVLAVTGNISFEEALHLTEKWFGPIPRREVPLRQLPPEPVQTEERRLVVERNVPLDSLFMAYHMCNKAPCWPGSNQSTTISGTSSLTSFKGSTLEHPVMGFPGGASGKEPTCQCRTPKRHGFDFWSGKIPWRIPWAEEPSGLLDMLKDLASTHAYSWTPRKWELAPCQDRLPHPWNQIATC